MASKSVTKDQRKKVILGVLLLVLVGVAVYQFVFSTPPPKPKLRGEAGGQTATVQTRDTAPVQSPRQARSASVQEAELQQELSDTSPLNFAVLAGGSGGAGIGSRGNIFAYYVPPPKPPPPPPPPPPITLQYVQPQTAVAGTPRQFTLTVFGKDFPPDAQIILGGQPRQTRRVNDTTLSTEIAPAEYASQRNVNVEVKSQSDPVKFYSNPIPFIVQPSPEPPFKFIGRIGELGLFEIAGTKEVLRQPRGGTIQGVWRIEAITDAAAEVTDTRYDIRKRLAMQDVK